MPDCRRFLSGALVEERGVVVRVGHAGISREGLLVSSESLRPPPEVLERDAEVEGRRGMAGARLQGDAVMRGGRGSVALLVEEAAKIHVGVGMMRLQLYVTPVGVARVAGGS